MHNTGEYPLQYYIALGHELIEEERVIIMELSRNTNLDDYSYEIESYQNELLEYKELMQVDYSQDYDLFMKTLSANVNLMGYEEEADTVLKGFYCETEKEAKKLIFDFIKENKDEYDNLFDFDCGRRKFNKGDDEYSDVEKLELLKNEINTEDFRSNCWFDLCIRQEEKEIILLDCNSYLKIILEYKQGKLIEKIQRKFEENDEIETEIFSVLD